MDIRPVLEDGVTGIFGPGYGKIAAFGINCRRGMRPHGVATNVEQHSLPHFAGVVVPCALTKPHGQVTCVSDLVERPITVADVAQYMRRGLERILAIKLV